jgi:cytochrome P450
MFVAGTDTTSTMPEWAMAELINHPHVRPAAEGKWGQPGRVFLKKRIKKIKIQKRGAGWEYFDKWVPPAC